MFRCVKNLIKSPSLRGFSTFAEATPHASAFSINLTEKSSFFARGVAAVYCTHDIDAKLCLISDAIALWRGNQIPLLDWTADKDIYAYLHYGVASADMIPTQCNTKHNGVTLISTSPDHISWMYPARPPGRPELVPTVPGHKILKVPQDMFIMHSLAHVELNAVDMYMDTVIRFACMPPESAAVPSPFAAENPCPKLTDEFVSDMLSIVEDESRHFRMVAAHLAELSQLHGRDLHYGSIPGVNSLWNLGVATRHCIAERLAVIPLSQEARGLDAASRFAERLYSLTNHTAAQIVEQIGEEEESHVRSGLKWFAWVAWQQGLVPHPDLPTPRVPTHVKLGVFERHDNKGVERRHDGGKAKQEWKARVAELQTGSGINAVVDERATGVGQPAGARSVNEDEDVVAMETLYYHADKDSEEETNGHMRALGQYWQEKVSPHFPDGFFPPFNRLARYAAGMDENWYLPLMNRRVFVSEYFHSVPSSAPMQAKIRDKYRKLTQHLREDDGSNNK